LAFVIQRFVVVLLLVAASGLSQPVLAAVSGAANSAKKTPAEVNSSDSQIERTMRAKLAKSKLSADHFTFSVSQGVVTIEGTTSVMQHKGVMTRMAKSSGAVAVHNNIRISDAAKAKATANLASGRKAALAPPAVPASRSSNPSPAPPVAQPAVPRAV